MDCRPARPTFLCIAFALLILLSGASLASADSAGVPSEPQLAASTDFTCPDPTATAGSLENAAWASKGPGARAMCTAVCQQGSNRTVNCLGECTAVDQNCAAGRRGYAQCNGGSKNYCDPCPVTATCTAECEIGPDRTLSCENGCGAIVDQNCSSGVQGYVQCAGSPLRYSCQACPSCPNEYCSGGPCQTDADCCGTIDGGGSCTAWGTCICP